MSTNLSSTESRALALLGSGVSPTAAAAALGVTDSRISQLLSSDDFAAEVADRRFQNLAAHTLRDGKYDSLEDDLLERMKDCIPSMLRPHEILRAISVINAAKRRGSVAAAEAVAGQEAIVSITLPKVLVNQFVTNIQNQVVQIGAQNLNTMQSGTLLKNLEQEKMERVKEGVRQLTHREDPTRPEARTPIPTQAVSNGGLIRTLQKGSANEVLNEQDVA